MKISGFLIMVSLLLTTAGHGQDSGAFSSQAQFITNHNSLFMPSVAKPAVGLNLTDPVFGTNVKRLSNALVSGSLGIAPQYSKRQAWNANDSLMLLLNCDDGYFSLYDGNTGQFIRPLDDPPVGGEDVFWHPSDKYRIIYTGDSILYSYDIRSNERTPLHIFTAYTWINTRGEGNLSNDGRYYAFIGQNYDYGTGEVTFSDIVVYDLFLDQIIGLLPIPHDSTAGAIDWLSISPSGNYVVVDHSDSDSARHHGIEVYDRNLNFIWQRPVGAGHSDLAVDADNQDVLVKDVYGVDSNVMRICKYRLSNALQTTLLTLDWTFDLHISCRNVNRPGYCFVSTFDYVGRLTDDSLSWLPFEDEIFALKLDGSGYTERIAHHHSRRFSPLTPDPDNSVYWAEPHATVNRAGTKVLWGSNWRQEMNLVTSVDTYLCDFSLWVGIPQQLQIGNVTIGTGQTSCYNATQTITIAGSGTSFTVNSGGAAEFIAGSNITFLPGVHVWPGGHLTGRITTNSVYCNQPGIPAISIETTLPGDFICSTDTAGKFSKTVQPLPAIWPNPSSGFVHVTFPEKASYIVRVIDQMGHLCRDFQINNTLLSHMDFSGLTPGVYQIVATCVEKSAVYSGRVIII